MTKRMLIMVAGVLVLVAALAFGFFLHIKALIASAPKPGAQTVSTMKIAALEWQPHLTSVGSLVPAHGLDVTTEIAGLVRSVNFKSGQEVKADQLLVQLNVDAEMAQLHANQAAADLAATVLKRDQAQLAIQAVSQAQVDADTADLKAKQAQVAQQQAVVDKKTIRAPFSGRLGITTVMVGQYLNTGDRIVTLQNIQPIYADFYLPQQRISSLSVGQTVNILTDAYPGETFIGKVTTISPKVDTATRNVQVEATINNPKQQLLPGMFANVSINVGAKARYLTLPQTAITYNPYGSTVFVVQESDKADASGNKPLVAQQKFVTTGETRGDQVAITKGLQEGEMVVTSGQIKLKNGTPVLIDNSVQPANSPNPTPQEH